MCVDDKQELQKRIEAKVKQEQEKKGKAKKKRKQESSRQASPVDLDNIQSDTPPETPTMPIGRRDDVGSDDDELPYGNHYWSLRDIPKFEGKFKQLKLFIARH